LACVKYWMWKFIGLTYIFLEERWVEYPTFVTSNVCTNSADQWCSYMQTIIMHPRTRLVYFCFLRVSFLVEALTSGRRDQVRLPWQRPCQCKYGCFCSSPQVTNLHTKDEGGLWFFISNFASLSRRIAFNWYN